MKESRVSSWLFCAVLWFAPLFLGGRVSGAAELPADVLSKLNSYDVLWTTPSTNGSPGSLPLGNGDITANVWVENGGDLMMYIGKSDSWSEATRLLKIGRTRMHFTPNPFVAGAPFSETLDLYHGEIDITAGQPGSQVYLRLWIDANQPVIRVEAGGDQAFTLSCSNEVWRSNTYTLPSSSDPNAGSFRGVVGGPTLPSESADTVVTLTNQLLWYHRDASSFYQTIMGGENMSSYVASFPDPYLNRTFGATVQGVNFTTVNNTLLQSASGTNFVLSIYPYTAQTSTAALWQAQESNLVAQVNATDLETARSNHYGWWDAFWNRSWIFASGDANATNVTRGYLLQRFMEACQGRGNYPMKFNGGTFTFDYNGQNGDYRTWGPGYWHQNTRHLYWPLLASGDWDLMMPFFNRYTNMLALQTLATTNYYGHGGAFFPETFNNFGLYLLDDWGWGRSNQVYTSNTYIKYHYQGGLETLGMMLAYYNYSGDGAFATNYIVPFATQVIRFFNQHWSRVNGKIFFYPANALEMYWSCTNSTDYISGLMDDIPKLMALPANYTTSALLNEWSNCLSSLPPLPMDAGGTRVLPAQTYGAANNSENPECYCIFPYRLFGLGKSNFNVGLATFVNRTIQNNKNCWSQDVIEEPLVGLTSEAQADVLSNFTDKDSQCRFPAFWTSNHDYLPDLDNGGAGMTGLQFMLLQCNGSQIMPLPSWPLGWDVDFKLCAPSNTTVRLVLQGGVISQLATTPSSRTNDLVEAVPAAPASLTANAGNTQIGLNWAASEGASGYNVKRSTASGQSYLTVASNVTSLSYINTGLHNGTNYYYVVSAINLWGEGANSTEVSVTPGTNIAAQVVGDLIVNLRAADLSANGKAWTNRTGNSNSVGNFSAIGGGNLNVSGLTWNGQAVNTLYVNGNGNNSVQSALSAPAEITGGNPVSGEVWVYATSVAPGNCALNYGKQGGSAVPLEDREFNYETGGYGAFSGFFGNADTGWATAPTTGAWHYLAYTYDGTNVKVYQDGSVNGSLTGVSLVTLPSFIQVGSDISGTNVNGGNDAFKGYIASARLESGVLSAGSIAANYVLGPIAVVALPAPVGLLATPGDRQVSLQWTSPTGGTGYNVKRALTNGGPYAVIATNLALVSYTDTGLTNGTIYYYVVSVLNGAVESANSAQVSVVAGQMPAVSFKGDLIANLESADLNANGKVWTNRTSNSKAVGNFTTLGGGNLNVATIAYGSGTIKALNINSTGNNSVQSALVSPAEINGAGPVSAEAWVYATSVAPTSATLNYGYQVTSQDRDFNYDTSGHGAISGNNDDTSWTTTPTIGVWHYLAYTYDGTTFRAYVDGSLDKSASVALNTHQTFVQVGSDIGGTGTGGGNDPFHGYIAAARLESGVLTANDIATNYALGPQATPGATTPTGLNAMAGDGQAILAWNAAGNATGYNVKRAQASNGVYAVIGANVATVGFTNTGLTNGTAYYYAVSGTNAAGESADSAPVGVRPVSLAAAQLDYGIGGGHVQLMWGQDHMGWRLEMETNSLGSGLGTNWVTVPASNTTNEMTLPLDPTGPGAFFRLVYP